MGYYAISSHLSGIDEILRGPKYPRVWSQCASLCVTDRPIANECVSDERGRTDQGLEFN